MTFHSRRIPDTPTPASAGAPEAQTLFQDHFEHCAAEMRRQFDFVSQGSMIGANLKTLAEMLGHSISAVDGDPGHAASDFGYLVADIMGVMATRLSALEDQARASIDHCEARVA